MQQSADIVVSIKMTEMKCVILFVFYNNLLQTAGVFVSCSISTHQFLYFLCLLLIFLINQHKILLHVSSRSSVLLLAPLLAEADPAPRRVTRPTGSAGAQGTDGLHTNFRWMAEHVPAFRVPGAHIHILTSPDQFYQAMKVGVPDEPNALFQLQQSD